ncbi:STAS domain-containing protein [Actinocorallia longicatena]|uniref:Anti-sigma factor antagonist n=1 Tax=Actinocorallia longicatena TaxID=111803 RepID=A0ABP6Q596_9ACTN
MNSRVRRTEALRLETDPSGGFLVLGVTGDMDHVGSAALAERSLSELERHGQGPWRVVLDLGRVEFLDSSGLGAIAGLWKRVVRGGGHLVVARPPRLAEIMLRRTGLDRYIPVGISMDAARRLLAEGVRPEIRAAAG